MNKCRCCKEEKGTVIVKARTIYLFYCEKCFKEIKKIISICQIP